ncbi:Gamma-tubulin complex component 5 [Podochytrium sp. JEL0797]|nr:Gamma-tubulin complex component 5 [Podochytrium sp. JEL0797]
MQKSRSSTSLATTKNIHLLVSEIAGPGSSAGDAARRARAARTCEHTLAFHPFRSPDESRVVAQYEGLAEKWDLFGLTDKATALRLLLAEALARKDLRDKDSLNQFAIHQALAFILAMSKPDNNQIPSPPLSGSPSSSPSTRRIHSEFAAFATSKQHAAESAAIVSSSLAFMQDVEKRKLNPKFANEQLWREIVDSDPLEGDHWASVDYSHDYSDSDGSDDEFNMESELPRQPPIPVPSPVVDAAADSANLFSDLMAPQTEIQDDPALTALLRSHFWNANHGAYPQYVEFDLNIPSTLAPSIASHQSLDPEFFGAPITTTNYVTELDVIREALYVLAGVPGEMFEIVADGLTCKPKMIACVTHLTVGMLESVLTRFAKLGTVGNKLRHFVKRVQDDAKDDGELFKPCLQAVSSVTCETLDAHQAWIVDRQAFYFDASRVLKDGEEPTPASLLALLTLAESKFRPLRDLHACILEAGKVQQQPLSPVAFVNVFTSHVVSCQGSCDADRFRWAVGCLMRILEPWFDAVQVWWLDGLVGSGVGFRCNDAIESKSNDFWVSKFTVKSSEVPLVLQSCLETVMSVGKCLVMVREMNPELLVDIIPELRSDIFSNILAKFSILMDMDSADCGVDSEPDLSIAASSSMVSENKSSLPSSELLLFNRVWQPEPSGGDFLSTMLGTTAGRDVDLREETRTGVEAWCEELGKKELNESQLWRPFQENFERSISFVLTPHFERVGQILTAQLVGPKCRLLAHLRTLQRVFLMTSGVVMGPMLDVIADKIRSGDLWRRPGVLQSIFDASVATLEAVEEDASQWIEEPNRVVLIIDESSVTQDMKKRRSSGRIHVSALEAVKVGYDVSWPLNCIVTPSSLVLYNKAIIFLLQLSLARNRLDKESLSMDKRNNWAKYGWMRQRTVLRRKMKVFCEGMTSFAKTTVRCFAIDAFMAGVVGFYDIDELNKFHEAFLTDICNHFFLLNEKATICKCLDLCIKFSDMCMKFDSNIELIRAGRSPVAPPSSPSPSPTPVTTPPKPSTPPFGFGKGVGAAPMSPKSKSLAARKSGTFERPKSPAFTQMKRPASFQFEKSSSLSQVGSSVEMDRIARETEQEGIRFGNAVSAGVFDTFVETLEFVVNSVDSLASHGMPKLAALAVYLKC